MNGAHSMAPGIIEINKYQYFLMYSTVNKNYSGCGWLDYILGICCYNNIDAQSFGSAKVYVAENLPCNIAVGRLTSP